jgi:tetratricopeptide (TPR) repeat protein
LSVIGNVHVSDAEYEKALAVSREWYRLAFEKHNEPEMNRANYLLVLVLYRQGENDTAVAISRRILETPQAKYDSVTLPKFNALIAGVALRKGDFTTAITYYLEAFRIAELTRNEQLQTVCLSNLSILNEELNNLPEALKYQRKALALAIKHNEILNVGLIYENMGTTYQEMAMHDSALYFYNKALPIFKQLQSEENIAIIYNYMGEMLKNLGQLDSAMYYLQLAKKQFTLIGSKDSPKIADNRMRIGETWIKMADAQNNKSYLKNALAEILVSLEMAEKEKIQNVKMSSYWA